MKVTIIPTDNMVYIDGQVRPEPLDLTLCNIPENVHALQWKDTKGWIEFEANDDGNQPPNESINQLPSWAECCVGVWESWTPPEPPPEPTVNSDLPVV